MIDWKRKSIGKLDVEFVQLSNHTVNFIRRGPTLFVTFFPDNLRAELPWGSKFLESIGHSIIGIQYDRSDWYRASDLHRFIRSTAFLRLLDEHEKVIFYGASKGGYGSLAFSSVVERPIVLAMAPQSTLDTRIVPWEKRYLLGQSQDWDGDFRDAAELVKPLGRYHLVYDPFCAADRRHALRITGPNVFHHQLPFSGHLVPLALRRYGILRETVELCRDGELTVERFARLARARRNHFSFYLNMRDYSRSSAGVKKLCLEYAAGLGRPAPEVLYATAVDAYRARRWTAALILLELIIERKHSAYIPAAEKLIHRIVSQSVGLSSRSGRSARA